MIAPFLDIDRDGRRPAAALQIFFWALEGGKGRIGTGVRGADPPLGWGQAKVRVIYEGGPGEVGIIFARRPAQASD